MKAVSQYYDCSLHLLLLLELSFSTVLAHTLGTLAEFTAFFVFPSHTNTTHRIPSASGYRHNYKEAECFQATPTLLTNPRYACTTLRYQPFFLNIFSPFSFPYNAGTDILDDLHKHQYSLQLTIFYSLCLKYQVWTVREISQIETEKLPKMYIAFQVLCR